MFTVPHSRPTELSCSPRLDPPNPEEATHFLTKSDTELEWQDFCFLFCSAPAGTFGQVAYFVPYALRYARENPQYAFQYLSHVISFVANNWDQIVSEKWSQQCIADTVDCFDEWTATFIVHHFNESDMRAIGSSRPHADFIANNESVFELLDSAAVNESKFSLAEQLCKMLFLTRKSWQKGAWAMEYIRRLQDGDSVVGKCNRAYISNAVLLNELKCEVNFYLELHAPHYWSGLSTLT